MRRLMLMVVLLIGLWAPVAQAEAPRRAWSADTADLLPEGRTEIGLFGPARQGLSSDVELQAHPLWFFVAPHFGAKLHLVSDDSWSVSSRHTLSYPSVLLGLLSREGTGGVLPVETEVPHIINLTQDVVATLALREDQRLSFRAGLRLALSSGESTLPTIDVPVVYPRTAAWHEGFATEVGIAWSGRVYSALFGGVSIDLFLVPGGEDSEDSWHYAAEVTPHLTWRITESWALMGGAKIVQGTYPFGEQSHVLPLVDVTFGWGAVE
jgi:hypothetical protein